MSAQRCRRLFGVSLIVQDKLIGNCLHPTIEIKIKLKKDIYSEIPSPIYCFTNFCPQPTTEIETKISALRYHCLFAVSQRFRKISLEIVHNTQLR